VPGPEIRLRSGDWLFHCHVLEHMEAGMLAVFRVA